MVINDTIVAISSVVVAAARGIVRLSGPQSFEIATTVADAPREAGVRRVRVRWMDQTVSGWEYGFIGPRSATGEDVVELHLPGNPVILRATLNSLINAGARPAQPGEFTARAYFNGRIDLAQAEGVAATIAAANEAELHAARQLLGGELARRLRPARDALAETLALIEAGIDFSEEDVSFLVPDQLLERVRAIDGDLDRLLAESHRFSGLVHEPTVVLVGRPNAGKSTLLNALSGQARAVVSPVAGTTRDVIWTHVPLRRGLIRLLDAAGLEHVTASPNNTPAMAIARQMQDRSVRSVTSANVVVLVRDSTDANSPPDLGRAPDLVVHTKGDLLADAPTRGITVSAVTGAGMDDLRERLDQLAFGTAVVGSALALNDRHVSGIATARDALGRIAARPASPGEIVALELREALDSLGTVLGQVTPDDVLSRVFATFCIGK